jgi:GT2 family glycosyltransferase
MAIDTISTLGDIYHRMARNEGYASAANIGVKISSHDYIVVMNNDAGMLADWISHAMAIFEDDPTAGVVCAGGGYPIVEIEPPWWIGALWMTKRSIIDDLGALDADYEMGFFEDLDFVMRLREKGYKIMRGGSIDHVQSASWHWYRGRAVWGKNKRLFMQRWGHRWKWQAW